MLLPYMLFMLDCKFDGWIDDEDISSEAPAELAQECSPKSAMQQSSMDKGDSTAPSVANICLYLHQVLHLPSSIQFSVRAT